MGTDLQGNIQSSTNSDLDNGQSGDGRGQGERSREFKSSLSLGKTVPKQNGFNACPWFGTDGLLVTLESINHVFPFTKGVSLRPWSAFECPKWLLEAVVIAGPYKPFPRSTHL